MMVMPAEAVAPRVCRCLRGGGLSIVSQGLPNLGTPARSSPPPCRASFRRMTGEVAKALARYARPRRGGGGGAYRDDDVYGRASAAWAAWRGCCGRGADLEAVAAKLDLSSATKCPSSPSARRAWRRSADGSVAAECYDRDGRAAFPSPQGRGKRGVAAGG